MCFSFEARVRVCFLRASVCVCVSVCARGRSGLASHVLFLKVCCDWRVKDGGGSKTLMKSLFQPPPHLPSSPVAPPSLPPSAPLPPSYQDLV